MLFFNVLVLVLGTCELGPFSVEYTLNWSDRVMQYVGGIAEGKIVEDPDKVETRQ